MTFIVWALGPLLAICFEILYYEPTWKIYQAVIDVEYFNGIITAQSILYVFWPIIMSKLKWKEMDWVERFIYVMSFVWSNLCLILSVTSLIRNSLNPTNPEASMKNFMLAVTAFYESIILLAQASLLTIFKTSHKLE